jgi:hypothetical protein
MMPHRWPGPGFNSISTNLQPVWLNLASTAGTPATTTPGKRRRVLPRPPARPAEGIPAMYHHPGQRPAMPSPRFLKEITVNRTHRIRRLCSILAGLAVGLLALAASPSASAQVDPPEGRPNVPAQAAAHIHAIATGGMPGWQITLIAAGAAALAAVAAVLLDRARTARRTTAQTI